MATRTLPIFPLGIVLFPGTPQPLHIFEPRYRQMLADCLAGDRRFGISFVSGEGSESPNAQLADVGCTALIEQVWPLPDGRSNLLAVGETRYVLQEFVETDRPYRIATVEPFDDEPWGDTSDLDRLADELREAFRRFAIALGALTDKPLAPMNLPEDPAALSFHVAASLDVEAQVKQELLESRSPRERITRLTTVLEHVTEDVAQRARIHQHAKRNGRGKPANGSALKGR